MTKGCIACLVCRRGSSQGTPYIKISEEEIADDYPMPAQYKKVTGPTLQILTTYKHSTWSAGAGHTAFAKRMCRGHNCCLQVEDEMDEMLLMEDDAFAVDPESLPRRILTDFAVYNSEVALLVLNQCTP